MTRPIHEFSKPQLALIGALSIIAFGFSGYLAWHAFQMTPVAGCGSGSIFNCDHVLTSKWSKFLGLPVAAFATLTYATLLTSLVANATGNSAIRSLTGSLISFFCWLAGAAAIWFIGLQVFVIGHLCQYCLVAHSCGLLLALTVGLSTKPFVVSRPTSLIGAIMAIAVLGVAQTATQPAPTYQVQEYATSQSGEEVPADVVPLVEPALFEPELFDPAAFDPELVESEVLEPEVASTIESADIESDTELPADRTPAPATASPAEVPSTTTSRILRPSTELLASLIRANASPLIQIILPIVAVTQESVAVEQVKVATQQRVSFGRIATLRTDQWPLIGDKMAPHVTAEMFDYTCPSCRATAPAIEKAYRDYNGKLAIIALPVPINRNCNDTVATTPAGHELACELAKVAISVWLVKPDKFPEFHHWMMEGDVAPSVDDAMAQARKIAGSAVDKMYRSKRPDQYLRANIQIYKLAGKGKVPKLLLRKTSLVGKTTSAEVIKNLVARD